MPDDQKKRLTAKQKLFVLEYLKNFNATQAAINAGYSKKTAAIVGFENLRKPNIIRYIDEAMTEIINDKDQVIIQNINFWKTIRDDENESTPYRLKATEYLGKWTGMFIDKLKLSGKLEADRTTGFQIVDKDGNPIETKEIDYDSLTEEEAKRQYFNIINSQ